MARCASPLGARSAADWRMTSAAVGNDAAAGIRSRIARKKIRSISARWPPPTPSTATPVERCVPPSMAR